MSSSNTSKPSSRIPSWLRVKLPTDESFGDTARLLKRLKLHTVCQSALCPNRFECFQSRTATFLILGAHCTRHCAFCNIDAEPPEPVDPDEPRRAAEAAAELGLGHVVVTSVTRDDLPDGGAGRFAAAIRALRAALPASTVEVLIPDFQGDESALATVLEA
ncbi:MAG: lipoyl synthase, partial [Desulfovibrionaceae bacterium]